MGVSKTQGPQYRSQILAIFFDAHRKDPQFMETAILVLAALWQRSGRVRPSRCQITFWRRFGPLDLSCVAACVPAVYPFYSWSRWKAVPNSFCLRQQYACHDPIGIWAGSRCGGRGEPGPSEQPSMGTTSVLPRAHKRLHEQRIGSDRRTRHLRK